MARFAARYVSLGFTIADETLALMTTLSTSGELDELTAERVWKEFSRALMEPSPEVFLQVLQQCKALSVLLPELLDLPLIEKVLKQAAIEQQPLVVRWACLMIPLALAGKINSIKTINERFKVPNDCSDLALLTGQYLVVCQQSLTKSTDELLNLLQRTDILRRPERLLLLLEVCVLLAKVTGQLDNKETYLPSLFLKEITEAVRAVKPQPLIAKGLQGAALGEALIQQRLAVIAQIKEGYL